MGNKNKQLGFTIVELLIVIVVIGILAAITLVAFNGIRDRADAAAIQSDLSNFAKRMEIARAESDTGSYPTSLTAALDITVTKSAYDQTQNNFYFCLNRATNQYAVGARSRSGQAFVLTATGVETRSSIWGSDTCTAASTTWGGANTTNVTGYSYNAGSGSWAGWIKG